MSINLTLNKVGSLIDTTTAATTINSNFAAVVSAFEDALDVTNTSIPNQMEGPLDMNSNPIVNLPAPISLNSPLRLADANTLNGGGTITGLPAGGTTGQGLVKTSNTDYVTGWEAILTGPNTTVINNLMSWNSVNGTLTKDSGIPSNTLITLTGTETLSNKTLSSPIINSPAVTGGTFSSPAITTPSINFATGVASNIAASSTNTGFQNSFFVSNAGTASNSATVADLFVNLSTGANTYTQLAIIGGATPTALLQSGAGITGGFTISATAGPLNITNPILSTPNIGVATGTSLALSGALSASGINAIAGGFPLYSWDDTSAGTDIKRWQMFASGGTLFLETTNDANTAAAAALTITRSGNSPLTVAIVPTTPSTSPTTGALTVAGGAGIAGALNVGTSITSPIVYGGSSAGSVLALTSTSSGSPSGDKITLTTGGAVRSTVLSNGHIGFGTETNPQSPMVISANTTTGLTFAGGTTLGMVQADGSAPAISLDAYNNGTATSGSSIAFRAARGTGASPANLVSGDLIGAISARTYTNGTFNTAPARISFTYNDTSPNLGTIIEFDNTPAGSTARAQSMRIMGGVIVGTGTTDPGAGNLLISGQYQSSTAPTAVSGSTVLTGSASTINNRMSVVLNGTTYWIPCSTTAF